MCIQASSIASLENYSLVTEQKYFVLFLKVLVLLLHGII